MDRFNFFHKLHKRLRALLHETGMLLQHTNFAAEEDAGKAIGQVQFMIVRFNQYQHAEETYLLPIVMDYEPGVADAFAQEHGEARRMGRKMLSLLNGFKTASFPAEQIALGKAILLAFQQFNWFLNHHMAREEQMANTLLRRYYTDAELQTLAWKMVNSAGSALVRPYGRKLVHNLNNKEILRWLGEIRIAAPEVAFTPLPKNAEDDRRHRHGAVLQKLLAAGTLLAN